MCLCGGCVCEDVCVPGCLPGLAFAARFIACCIEGCSSRAVSLASCCAVGEPSSEGAMLWRKKARKPHRPSSDAGNTAGRREEEEQK